MSAGLLAVHAAATLFMTGLIWFVQVVHYPLMERVGRDSFAGYESAHTRRTSRVVGPPMLVEGVTASMIVFGFGDVPAWQAWLGLALLAAIWLSTATLQVPQHRRLAAGFDSTAHRKLVATNWLRVVGWSLRSVLALVWIVP